MKKFNLEERLINFSELIVEVSRSLPPSKEGSYLSGQLVRSGLSPALNYGEAISGESRKDFIHKIKIVLKELRETHNCLRIIQRTCNRGVEELIETALKENNELIAIFVTSVKTATANMGEGRNDEQRNKNF